MAKGRFKNSVILNFDGSVSFPPETGVDRLDLRVHEERFRYYARFADLKDLQKAILNTIGAHNVFFLGNGDFHHLSWLLIKSRPEKNLQVVVFDNHPDNMFFPRAVHCGSWVYHASKLPNVAGVSVLGVASRDLSGIDLFQNRFSVIKSGKVRYYCLAPVSKLAQTLSGKKIDDLSALREGLPEILRKLAVAGLPVYLSIDKDVLSPEAVKTTWDQGRLTEAELMECVKAVAPSVVAADVTGDISTYSFKSSVKKIVRWIDGFEAAPVDIELERKRHTELNMKILAALKSIA